MSQCRHQLLFKNIERIYWTCQTLSVILETHKLSFVAHPKIYISSLENLYNVHLQVFQCVHVQAFKCMNRLKRGKKSLIVNCFPALSNRRPNQQQWRCRRQKWRCDLWRWHCTESSESLTKRMTYFLLVFSCHWDGLMRLSVDAALHYKVNPWSSRPTDGRPAGLQGPLSCRDTGWCGCEWWGWRKRITLALVTKDWMKRVRTQRRKKNFEKKDPQKYRISRKIFHAVMSLGRRKQSCNPILIALDLLNRSSRFKSQQITQKAQGDGAGAGAVRGLCNQVHLR